MPVEVSQLRKPLVAHITRVRFVPTVDGLWGADEVAIPTMSTTLEAVVARGAAYKAAAE